MAKKRKPAFVRILDGMNCCYGGQDERDCGSCPYDKYNDSGFYGEGGAECMLRLNQDAKKWAESMECFTTCLQCIYFSKSRDENGEWRFVDDDKTNDGYCSLWKSMMLETEYCSRGGMRDE